MKELDVDVLKGGLQVLEKLPIEEIYKDGLHQGLKEVGEGLGDLVYIVRRPLSWVRSFLEDAEDKVPKNSRQNPPLLLAGPSLEGAKFSEPGDVVYELFNNLLARAMDRERVGEAHPAFPNIISQLAPHEAYIVYVLGQTPISVRYITRNKGIPREEQLDDIHETHSFTPDLLIENSPDEVYERWYIYEVPELVDGNYKDLFVEHLISLNLCVLKETSRKSYCYDERVEGVAQITVYYELNLSGFGELFRKACVPETPPTQWGW